MPRSFRDYETIPRSPICLICSICLISISSILSLIRFGHGRGENYFLFPDDCPIANGGERSSDDETVNGDEGIEGDEAIESDDREIRGEASDDVESESADEEIESVVEEIEICDVKTCALASDVAIESGLRGGCRTVPYELRR